MSGNPVKTSFPPAAEIRHDEIIDVRSPGEFAEDHISGALNLPVLDDAERARVGTIYKQVSPFAARKIGAGLISANVARHLEGHFAEKGKDYRPMLYCWRGGQRSGSLALILAEIGFRTAVIEGGYKTYRAEVIREIENRSETGAFVVLNGFTGAGKTRLLHALELMGEQVMDLESLASHKGSAFGGDPERPQPAQKRFESLLYDLLSRFEPGRPIFLEAESAKVGRLNLPRPLWQRMKVSPVVEIVSPLATRAAHLTADYRKWMVDPERVCRAIDLLKGFHADRTLAEWKTLTERGEWEELVTRLLSEHYDSRYLTDGSGHFQSPAFTVELAAHDEEWVRRVAAELVERVAALKG